MKFIFNDVPFWARVKLIFKTLRHRTFCIEVPDEKIRLEDSQGNEIEAVRVDK